MRRGLVFILLLVSCVSAWGSGGEVKKASTANQIDMPFLVAPASQNGTLIGYHYMSFRLITPSAGDAAQVRTKLAFIQDAFVRDVYRSSVSLASAPDQVDKAAVHERLMAIVRRIAGARMVSDLVFVDIKFAPLHPKPGGALFTTTPGNDNGSSKDGNGKNSGALSPH